MTVLDEQMWNVADPYPAKPSTTPSSDDVAAVGIDSLNDGARWYCERLMRNATPYEVLPFATAVEKLAAHERDVANKSVESASGRELHR